MTNAHQDLFVGSGPVEGSGFKRKTLGLPEDFSYTAILALMGGCDS